MASLMLNFICFRLICSRGKAPGWGKALACLGHVLYPGQVKKQGLFDVGGIHTNIKISPTINSKVDLTKLWHYLNKDHFVKMGPWEGPEATR
jgi:hypothetical protein